MAAKLSSDYIKWTLTINSSQAQKEINSLSESTKELEKSNKVLRERMGQLVQEGKKSSKEYNDLNKALKENKRIVSENKAKIEQLKSTLDLSALTANQLSKRARELRRELMNTSKAADPARYKQLREQIEDVDKAYKKATEGSKGFRYYVTKGIKEITRGALLNIGQNILQQFTSTFSNIFSIIADFEAANSKLAAVLGTTADSIGELTDQARQLGAATSFSASEVTALQIELAKLGFLRTDIMAMTPEVLKFAKAVDTDLGSAAALTGAALRIFGLDAEQAGRAVSTMAVGTTTSALSFSYLQAALSTVGPVAASFGFTIEETTALLGALANSGFDASSAATATRNIMLAMADPAGKLSKALGQPVRSLDDLVSGLQKLNAEGVDLAQALDLTDKRSVAAFQTFLNGADSLSTLRDGVTDCHEAFDRMSAEMGNNVRGSLSSLSSALEGLVLQFYNSKGPIKTLIDALTTLVSWLGKTIDWVSSLHAALKIGALVIGTYIAAVKLHVAALILKTKATIAAAAAEYKHKVGLMASLTGCSRLTAAVKILYGTLLRHPYALLLSAVVAVAAAVIHFTSATSDAEKAQKALNDVKQKAIDKAQDEIAKIDLLVKAAQDETLALTERQKAVDRLNEIIPEYNAQIDATTGKYKASKKALDSYIDSLIRQYEIEGAKDKLKALGRQKADVQVALSQAEEKARNVHASAGSGYSYTTSWGAVGNTAADAESHFDEIVRRRKAELNAILAQEQAIRDTYGSDINASVANDANTGNTDDTDTTPTTPTPRTGTGNTGNTTRKSPAQQRLAELKEQHEAEIAAIRQYGYENNAAQAEIDMMMLKETERYATERYNALDELAAKTAQTDTEERQRIAQGQRQAVDDMLAAYDSIEQLQIGQAQKQRDTLLQQQEAWHTQQQQVLDNALAAGEISQGQHDAYLLQEGRAHADRMLEIQRQYADDIAALQIHSDEQRLQLQHEADQAVAEAHNETLRQAAAFSQRKRELTADPIGAAGLKQAYEQQVRVTQTSYDAMIEIARQAGLDVEELERHKQQKLSELYYERLEQEYNLQSQLGVSWQDEYEHELQQYKKMLDQELISDKDYQKKKLQLQINQAKKYFDYYSGLSSSMVSEIQQAEIDAVEAKYDVLIRDAENNGEDTAALEEEKENKKLEIQKKYADTNFAIKVSQIIADTAVAIMKAYADLGPIAGTVAAALIAATGAAQLVSAKAERDKIKHLQPKKTAGKTADASSSAATAERVLTGFAGGGYTGDGPRFEVAGIVHRGEYVVPKPIMAHPAVVDAVAVIEAIRAHAARPALPQFADGGFTSPQTHLPAVAGSAQAITEAAARIERAAAALRNVRAYVVYADIEHAADTLSRARAPFTRNIPSQS